MHRIPFRESTTDSTPSSRPKTIVHSPCSRSKSFGSAALERSAGDNSKRVSNSACFGAIQKLRAGGTPRRAWVFARWTPFLAENLPDRLKTATWPNLFEQLALRVLRQYRLHFSSVWG